MNGRGSGGRLAALGLHRKVLRSWALYDWANSAFATTIMAGVLPIYYVRVAAADLPGVTGTSYWGYTAAIALAIVALISPALGAIADYMGAKKRFLAALMVLGVLATAGLFFVREGDWKLASALYILGAIGFAGSIVFYASFLPHIASDEEMDRVAAGGWAVGYLGGGLLLVINAIMLTRPGFFGFADTAVASRWTFLTVAVWWAVFSIPLLRHVPEPVPALDTAERRAAGGAVVSGFRRLGQTFAEIRQYRDLLFFLVGFWFYSDGFGTIIKMGTAYGAELGFQSGALIGALVLVQFVGVPFTFAFGALAGRIGAKAGIQITLVGYTGISIFGYFMSQPWHFWVLAAGIGMIQGGAQALSRSLFASMIPRSKSSEFFGFYSVFEKFAGIMGPVVFGVAGQITGSSRFGILSLILFFVIGGLLLSRVDVAEGRRVARLEDAEHIPLTEPADTAAG